MLTPYSQSRFVEKILMDVSGRQFRAVFFVTLEGGEVKGRLVALKPVAQTVLALTGDISDGAFCLPAFMGETAPETPYFAYVAPVASPYFDLEVLLSSQPTRAPSNK